MAEQNVIGFSNADVGRVGSFVAREGLVQQSPCDTMEGCGMNTQTSGRFSDAHILTALRKLSHIPPSVPVKIRRHLH